MSSQNLPNLDRLLERISQHDSDAVAEVFMHYRERLKRMVQLRLDPRLKGRVDASDVVQEAFLDIAPRAAEYAARSEMPFFLWMRMVTGQRLLKVHRSHLQTQMRDAGQEVSIFDAPFPEASSVCIAGQLAAGQTSPSGAMMRDELQRRMQNILDGMEPIDREIIALRHFEELENGEVAVILGLSKTATSNRYLRAIKRLRDELLQSPTLQ